MPVKTSIRLRRGTASSWTSTNPVLSAGEPGVESDTGAIKIGDGTTAWSSLGYALSSRYAARADEFVWVGAGDFELGYASPSRNRLTNSGYPGWLLDASSIEGIIASARLPTHFSTFHVDLYWTNAGAGAGDAYIRFGVSMTGDGESLNNYSGKGFTSFGAVTAPAQWVLEVTRLTASAGTNQSGEILGIYIDRLADDAADTLGNDIAIVGVLITKAS